MYAEQIFSTPRHARTVKANGDNPKILSAKFSCDSGPIGMRFSSPSTKARSDRHRKTWNVMIIETSLTSAPCWHSRYADSYDGIVIDGLFTMRTLSHGD